jgi:hypothetical protein
MKICSTERTRLPERLAGFEAFTTRGAAGATAGGGGKFAASISDDDDPSSEIDAVV